LNPLKSFFEIFFKFRKFYFFEKKWGLKGFVVVGEEVMIVILFLAVLLIKLKSTEGKSVYGET
jgi:hypothetical protein